MNAPRAPHPLDAAAFPRAGERLSGANDCPDPAQTSARQAEAGDLADHATGAPHADLALLALTQWLSPAFPTGAFAHSHGLEWAVAQGEIQDAASALSWVADILEYGTGWTDAVLLARALGPDADHDALADTARALAGSRERRAETEALGAALARALRAVTGTDWPDRPFPVALGAAARALRLPAETVIALALQSFAANLLTVAVRIVPLGQSEGQAGLAALHPLILRLARDAARADLSDLRSSAFRAEMAAAWHETLQPRLFLT